MPGWEPGLGSGTVKRQNRLHKSQVILRTHLVGDGNGGYSGREFKSQGARGLTVWPESPGGRFWSFLGEPAGALVAEVIGMVPEVVTGLLASCLFPPDGDLSESSEGVRI